MKNNKDLREKRIHTLEETLRYRNAQIERLTLVHKEKVRGYWRSYIKLADDILYKMELEGREGVMGRQILDDIGLVMGSREKRGLIVRELNIRFDGIIDHLLKKCPGLTHEELNLFCHIVLDVKNRITVHCMEYRDSIQASQKKSALKRKIGKKMLYLHDLSKALVWKV